MTPLQAIKEKCLDCCAGQKDEVRACTAKDCPLYLFRLGKNMSVSRKRNYTEEQKKEIGERLKKAREAKKNEDIHEP